MLCQMFLSDTTIKTSGVIMAFGVFFVLGIVIFNWSKINDALKN